MIFFIKDAAFSCLHLGVPINEIVTKEACVRREEEAGKQAEE